MSKEKAKEEVKVDPNQPARNDPRHWRYKKNKLAAENKGTTLKELFMPDDKKKGVEVVDEEEAESEEIEDNSEATTTDYTKENLKGINRKEQLEILKGYGITEGLSKKKEADLIKLILEKQKKA